MDILKINGKEYPFSFSILAQRELMKSDLEKTDDFDSQIYLIWLGLKYGSIREKKEFTLTVDELTIMFDDDYQAWLDAAKILGERFGLMNQANIQAKK
jgi:hypothetical protein